MIKAALLCTAIFFTLATLARAQENYDKEIDTAIDAFAFAGKLGGVDVGEAGKALLKGAAKCVANDRPVLECARDYLVENLPERAKPMAKCLIQDLGNIDRNIGRCALEAAAPLLSKQIPPEALNCLINNPGNAAQCALGALAPKIAEQLPPDVQKCLKDNLNDAAKCAADTAVKAAIDKAMANVPPDVRRMAQCVTKLEKASDCDVLPPQVKQALEAAEKLKNEVSTASNIIKVAEGMKKDDWDQVALYGGAEVYKAAAKIVLNALLTPALAPIIGPAVDFIVDSRVQLVTDLIKALKKKDAALVIKIAAEFIMYEQIRPICALFPNDVKEATCGEVAKGISKVGDVVYGVLTCEAIKKGVVGDVYQFGCGLVNDTADIAWDAGEKGLDEAGKGLKTVGQGFEKLGEGLGDIGKGAVKETEKAWNAVKECELGNFAGAVCNEFKKKLSDAGDIAEDVVNAPVSWVKDIFGPDKDERRANNAECDGYAKRSVQQANAARQRNCGPLFGGPQWGTDYNGHYNWCMTVRVKTANHESTLRDESLSKCGFCQNYQQQTQAQVEGAKAQGCIDALRNRGRDMANRWGDNYGGHYEFCMWQPRKFINQELGARGNELNHCSFCAGFQKASDAQIQDAKNRGCIDQMRAINANRWGDGPGHMNWCMSSSNRAGPTRELGARAGDLGRCRPPTGTSAVPFTVPAAAPPPAAYVPPPPPLRSPPQATQPGVTIICDDGRPAAPGKACPRSAPVQTHVRCPDGSWAHPNQPCPPPRAQGQGTQPGVTIICDDGRPAAPGKACPRSAPVQTHVRCPDGSWAHPNQPCPPPRVQAQQPKTCPGGQVVAANAACPPTTKPCPGGQVVSINAACPPTTKPCPGGQVVSINAACPPTTKPCPGGQVVPITAACPAPPPPQNCRMEPDVSACGLVMPGGKPCKPPMKQVCGPSTGASGVR